HDLLHKVFDHLRIRTPNKKKIRPYAFVRDCYIMTPELRSVYHKQNPFRGKHLGDRLTRDRFNGLNDLALTLLRPASVYCEQDRDLVAANQDPMNKERRVVGLQGFPVRNRRNRGTLGDMARCYYAGKICEMMNQNYDFSTYKPIGGMKMQMILSL
ncbi:hypothetical protein ACFLZX_03420, partial [Nanoarchaeota archaeon]